MDDPLVLGCERRDATHTVVVLDPNQRSSDDVASFLNGISHLGLVGPVAKAKHVGIIFELRKNELRPRMMYRPGSLMNALYATALSDAALGVEYRPCANPECHEFIPLTGPLAYRKDAIFHSSDCRRRHAYVEKTRRLKEVANDE